MKGLELHINGKIISVAPQHGNVHILTSVLKMENREESVLVFSGVEAKKNEHKEWLNRQLEIGDQFTIRVVDVLENSKPIKTETGKSDELILEGKLKAYKSLKSELESLGLI